MFDLRRDQKLSDKYLTRVRVRPTYSPRRGLGTQLIHVALGNLQNIPAAYDTLMNTYFRAEEKKLFSRWLAHPLLGRRDQIVKEVRECYRRELWAACISTTLPLLDLVMRDYLESDRLNATVQILRDALFSEAKLEPKDLKPGYAIWDGKSDPTAGNTFAATLEEDLRLPGVYLASFFEFANRYYGWYSSSSAEAPTFLNRHAVIHCAAEYWTESHAVKLLLFLDLTLRVRPFLRILIHGADVVDDVLNELRAAG
jgi:hypothetical protein